MKRTENSPKFRTTDGTWSYTYAMAAESRKWKVVKTSGGYGVIKSVNGSTVSKQTVVRPSTLAANNRAQSVTSPIGFSTSPRT